MKKSLKSAFFKAQRLEVLFLAALSLSALSCASNQAITYRAMPEATLDLGSLSRDQYIILGQVSGTSSITVKSSDLLHDSKAYALGESKVNSYTIRGDSGNYGFIGNANQKNLTVRERAVALATYRMIETAQYNGADAILYVSTSLTEENASDSSLSTETRLRVTTTGLAVKLKADEGCTIELPPSQLPPKKVIDTSLPGIQKEENSIDTTKEESFEAPQNQQSDFTDDTL